MRRRGGAVVAAGMGCCVVGVVVGIVGWRADGGRQPAGCKSYQGTGAAVRAAAGWVLAGKRKTSPVTLVRRKTNPPPTLSLFNMAVMSWPLLKKNRLSSAIR